MKKLSIPTLLTFCLLVLGFTSAEAQVVRQANPNPSARKLTATQFSGAITGAIYINKSEIPKNVNINQIVVAVKKGLKAFEFIPQNDGFYPEQSIQQKKVKPLNSVALVNLKTTPKGYTIQYKIQKLPLMKPMTVRIIGNAAKSIKFSAESSLKNFPVAYLTTCDKVFECFNFKGGFIPVIK